jgi:hypothetical protein
MADDLVAVRVEIAPVRRQQRAERRVPQLLARGDAVAIFSTARSSRGKELKTDAQPPLNRCPTHLARGDAVAIAVDDREDQLEELLRRHAARRRGTKRCNFSTLYGGCMVILKMSSSLQLEELLRRHAAPGQDHNHRVIKGHVASCWCHPPL